MSKTIIVEKLSSSLDISKTKAADIFDAFIEASVETIQTDGGLALPGLGNFKVTQREERQGRNPKTGDPITIPAKKVVNFKAGKPLNEALNG